VCSILLLQATPFTITISATTHYWSLQAYHAYAGDYARYDEKISGKAQNVYTKEEAYSCVVHTRVLPFVEHD
jgi:hypothetical protein